MYEKLLKDLQSAGNAGEYYTPRALTQFIVEMINPQLGEVVFDPACGTGGFLANAIDHIRKQVQTSEDEAILQKSIRGTEKKQLPHLLCLTNMILHGFDTPATVRRANTLTRPLRHYGPADQVDVVVTNPPFGGIEEPGVEQNFPQSIRTRETADLFLALIIRILKPGGRAGMILPDGTLFGEGIKSRLKEQLLTECNLHTIVRIPGTAFAPYTTIATNLLFFTKGEPTKEVWFYEHRMPPNMKGYGKLKAIRIEEFEPEKMWWIDRTEGGAAWRVSIDEIRERQFNLDIKNPYRAEEVDASPSELLASYQAHKEEVSKAIAAIRDALREIVIRHGN